MSKQAYIQNVIDWVRLRGYSAIKANAADYTMPASYGRQLDGQSFVPDVTGQQGDQKSYFEIVLKTKDTDYLTVKLKLLHQLAQLSGGQLFLMTPKGHSLFAKAIADANRITAEIIILPDIKKMG
ncbi:hypothetical protein IC229_13030 [Spirosoma sp. BT702]|uniref:Uncharacterized protein n=1 Tax=Spirosoma profusum TaxID=2771354 RepID=A0A926Y0B9_9BACT|nr:hypothetical protein [Spirosoma profusum]MBD2701567.1 hypothetical protein [Spirosoma profusum]